MTLLGQFALWGAFVLGIWCVVLSFSGRWQGRPDLSMTVVRSIYAILGCLLVASLSLWKGLISHDFNIICIGERVGHQPVVGHWIGLHSVGHSKVDPSRGPIPAHRAGDDLCAQLEPHILDEGGICGGLGGELGRRQKIHPGLLDAFSDQESDAADNQRSTNDELVTGLQCRLREDGRSWEYSAGSRRPRPR